MTALIHSVSLNVAVLDEATPPGSPSTCSRWLRRPVTVECSPRPAFLTPAAETEGASRWRLYLAGPRQTLLRRFCDFDPR
jgi:hypothetical protein